MSSTRERIVVTSAELFRRQGYSATGIKQIVSAARAPFGSLYHFFPGGKEELGAEAIRVSGALYAQLIPAVLDPAPDPVAGVRDFFNVAAEHLRETKFADACPIATVALEVSSTSEQMRRACAEVFEGWVTAGAQRFERAGIAPATARELAIAMLAALEGAFVLARAGQTTEPLRIAGELAAARVETAFRATASGGESSPAAPPRTPQGDGEPVPTAAPVRPRLRARWPDHAAGRFPGPASP
jgi:AcrR family transcriptional regulator